jgi:GPI mannosyltransferase 3
MSFTWSLQSPRERGGSDTCGPMWQGVHVLAIGALALRLAVAWWSEQDNHPDTIFQYLEQAHRLVYGYGFVPWEFRFGARNWLLPGALAGLLDALRVLGLDRPTVYIPVMKSIFAVLSVSLVYASYTIGRHIFQEQSGRLAAVFAVVWYELLYSSVIPSPEVLGAYALIGGFALLVPELKGLRVASGRLEPRPTHAVAGLVPATSIAAPRREAIEAAGTNPATTALGNASI